MSKTKTLPPHNDGMPPVPTAWADHEARRAAERAQDPSERLSQRQLRALLEGAFDEIFAPKPGAKADRNREIIERRWLDGAPRSEVAVEFGIARGRVQTLEERTLEKLIPLRISLLDYAQGVPEWLREAHRFNQRQAALKRLNGSEPA